jgi:hypothetical protein
VTKYENKTIDLDNLTDILRYSLINKQLLYVNSQSYKNATIVDIVSVQRTEEGPSGIKIVLKIKQPFKQTFRQKTVKFRDNDSITISSTVS